MVGLLLGGLGVLALVAVLYIAGITLFRYWLGNRAPVLYHAILQFAFFGLLDAIILIFSVSFCTASIRDSIRLRGSVASNQLLANLLYALGVDDVDLPTMWGVIVPVLTWVSGHGVAFAGLLSARFGRGAVVRYLETRGQAGAVVEVGRHLVQLVGSLGALVGIAWMLQRVLSTEVSLIRFQLLSSSQAGKTMLGEGWMNWSDTAIRAALAKHFVGQVINHLVSIYAVGLLLSAGAMILAFHRLFVGAMLIPLLRYRPVPPPLPPDFRPESGRGPRSGDNRSDDNREPPPEGPAVVNIPPTE